VLALTNSANVKDYIKKLRKRDPVLDAYWGTNCPPVEMIAADGKKRKIKAANTESLLRIIQSVPSPKAEPFKRWLAKVGYERLEEIENPELAAKRMRTIYEQKGYSEDWIEKRLRGIAVRDELTDEWSKRGVKAGKEYAILTAEISKATFGMTPAEYKDFKALSNPKENLRDHMTDLELIFTMLGEASTTEIAKKKDAQGFPQNQQAAKAGGSIAGNARRELESKSGTKISTSKNFQALTESIKGVSVKKSNS
jgi:methylphosphotriester-DNA--protein-cysteine methyltransferase